MQSAAENSIDGGHQNSAWLFSDMHWLVAMAVFLTGAFALRSAVGGARWRVLGGWSAALMATLVLAASLGGEVGWPTAAVLISLAGLIVATSSATLRPWRAVGRERSQTLSPARDETMLRGASRWIAAGPAALAASLLPTGAALALLDAPPEDSIVLGMTIAIVLWSGLAAWAFSSRRPLRTLLAICVTATCGAAAAALGAAA